MSLLNLATKVATTSTSTQKVIPATTSTATQKINTVNAGGKVTIDTTKPLLPVPTVTNDGT